MHSRVIPLFLCLVAGPALAHSDAETANMALIDCEHPPKKLAKALPGQIAGVAKIECTPAAQFIVAREGWSWRYPGSFFDRPFIPAYAPMDSRQAGGSRFFAGFKAVELSRDEAKKRHETFVKDVPTYREPSPPARIVKLVARNDLGHEMDAYFGFRSDHEGWVVLCAPQCAPEYLFLMQKTD